MSKYKLGETSKTVIEKKNSITKSILRKTEIINKIKNYKDIPSNLEIKKGTISQNSVHKWSDSELDIITYSRNSAHAPHNSHALINLRKSIESANKRLINAPKNTNKANTSPTNLSKNEVDALKEENSELSEALAEVYRAYMQILDTCREDQLIDNAYRELILSQAKVLGKNRVWEVKNV
jgi:hypothetical protein